MIVIGLTGSVGMGKTTTANQLARLKVPFFNADAAVHRLMRKGGQAVPLIEAAFPHVVFGGAVERARLGGRVFDDIGELHRLEAILHPMVRAESAKFLANARRRRLRLVVLDIPLLFEGHGDHRVDLTLVASCPAFLQEMRVMARPGMTHGKLAAIRHRQMPDAEKRRRADVVIRTGAGHRHSLRQLCRLVTRLRPV
ncbi:MAG TPA: dephospho-CoA kinase [Rhodospirillaceae bacterium]|nr:dephospho-CoA kinase [Rhodospirillaceae bacterium]